MATNNNEQDNSGCGFTIILLTVVVASLVFLTPIGIILGIVLYVIFYWIMGDYFLSKDWREFKIALFFLLGLAFLGLAYYLGESVYDIRMYEKSSYIIVHTVDLMWEQTIMVGLGFLWDSYSMFPFWVEFFWVLGGSFITIVLFRVIASFGSNEEIEKVKKGIINSKYKGNISNRKFKKVNIINEDIGISYSNKKAVKLTSKMFNQMVLCLGTTGSGKTELLKNIYARNILSKICCIVVDAKPDPDNIAFLKALAKKNNVPFYSFNCADYMTYDFLNNGTPTEIKDKIIGLKNEKDWDSDYYKTQAETYLQTALSILKKSKVNITLDDVIDCMDFSVLCEMLPKHDKKLERQLSRIKDIDTKDLKGISNQLVLLANSDMGDWLSSGEGSQFTLLEAIEKKAFVYFALPSLKYPSFAKVMGKVVVNDLKTALYDKKKETPVYAIFDEFSVFAGEQVLNLVNQGRGLGLFSGFGIQTLADLSMSSSDEFLEMFMGNINTVMCQRVNDNKTTKYISDWVGTEEIQEYSADISVDTFDTGKVKHTERFLINPRELQQLNVGEAYMITKVGGFSFDKIKVNYLG
jgi:hypothetical protein